MLANHSHDASDGGSALGVASPTPCHSADLPDLADLARSYAVDRRQSPRSLADLPASTPQSAELASQLKSQGYRFVGPTSVYAFMQNVGVVNDHLHGCFRATD